MKISLLAEPSSQGAGASPTRHVALDYDRSLLDSSRSARAAGVAYYGTGEPKGKKQASSPPRALVPRSRASPKATHSLAPRSRASPEATHFVEGELPEEEEEAPWAPELVLTADAQSTAVVVPALAATRDPSAGTALVPAPPSALVPAQPSALVPAQPSKLVPASGASGAKRQASPKIPNLKLRRAGVGGGSELAAAPHPPPRASQSGAANAALELEGVEGVDLADISATPRTLSGTVQAAAKKAAADAVQPAGCSAVVSHGLAAAPTPGAAAAPAQAASQAMSAAGAVSSALSEVKISLEGLGVGGGGGGGEADAAVVSEAVRAQLREAQAVQAAAERERAAAAAERVAAAAERSAAEEARRLAAEARAAAAEEEVAALRRESSARSSAEAAASSAAESEAAEQQEAAT